MEFTKNPQGKYSPLSLVKQFFAVENRELIDFNKTNRDDVIQLASAIAREQKLDPADLSFYPDLAEY